MFWGTGPDDKDGLLTSSGAISLTRDPSSGLVDATSLGGVSETLGYNGFGELISDSFSTGSSSPYSEILTRDNLGRITTRAEVINGVISNYGYQYDLSGRLSTVTENGSTVSTYYYDSNSNRLSAALASGTNFGTYDAQDRILTYGDFNYAQTPNGERAAATNTVTGKSTSYSYDFNGNLDSVILPSGTQITYVIDGQGRRVGKQSGGALEQGYLYQNGTNRLLALTGASGNITERFVYGSRLNTPDYMIEGGQTYRIISDTTGSPRVVVNTSTGVIAEQISYDEFGNVTQDTSPGFQPFGFAGGIYDQDTQFVHFGARDYDPFTGRWLQKDPIGFQGGDPNVYGYVLGDPINFVDPSGLYTLPIFGGNSSLQGAAAGAIAGGLAGAAAGAAGFGVGAIPGAIGGAVVGAIAGQIGNQAGGNVQTGIDTVTGGIVGAGVGAAVFGGATQNPFAGGAGAVLGGAAGVAYCSGQTQNFGLGQLGQ